MLNNETEETTMDTTNAIAGSGQHSHEIPSELGRVVVMRDSNHDGTEVYRVEEGFRFVDLVNGEVSTAKRCVLVQLTDASIEEVCDPYACDLDSPDGLALIGCDPGDDVPGEILWDSDTTSARQA